MLLRCSYLKPGRLTAKGISVLASLDRVPCLACRTSWHGHRPLLKSPLTRTHPCWSCKVGRTLSFKLPPLPGVPGERTSLACVIADWSITFDNSLSFHSHFTHSIMIHLKRLLSLLVNRQVCHSWAWRTTWLNWARAPAERKQPGGQITLKTSSQKDSFT